jgi:hypothetical protein
VADVEAGRSLEVRGTPTLLINEWRFAGVPSMRLIDSVIESLLRPTR